MFSIKSMTRANGTNPTQIGCIGVLTCAVLFGLNGCKSLTNTTFVASSAAPIKPNRTDSHLQPSVSHQRLAPFTQVSIQGNIDATVHTNCRESSMTLTEPSTGQSAVQVTVQHGWLRIKRQRSQHLQGRVHVDLCTRYLSTWNYQGTGHVIGKNIQSNRLNATIDNGGNTLLQGQIALQRLMVKGRGLTEINGITGRNLTIDVSGAPRIRLIGVANATTLRMRDKGWLSLYWLNSGALNVRLRDQSFAQIAGIVDQLDVELWDNTHFNGRYLRGTHVFAKTHDHATADINVIRRQHTLALDSSNIYFYNMPDIKADFMANSGAVLDLRRWENPKLEERTRYNR